MSELANALKKIKQEGKKAKFSYGAVKHVSSLTLNKIYFLISILTSILIALYAYFKMPHFDRIVKDYVNLDEDRSMFNKKLSEYEKFKKDNLDSNFYSSLIKKDFASASRVIEQMDNKSTKVEKLKAFLYFAKDDYTMAKSLLESYVQKEKDPSAINLISYIYYSYGDYVKANEMLQKEDLKDGNLLINKGMLAERLGDLRAALEFYEKGLTLIDSDVIKYKVKIKVKSIKLALGIQ
ncbi:MAG: hypothetical protein C0187_06625 [Calditerrivibrio nitroreducens]|uniref:Uncharacterized protein n=1 Tax=Calditerrivibrio nitroreducens TaxID=477976 RepID=A0A2J6WGZ0_9BACT|nr:MAG: hypothetical protein C0187_06625 [Calditerrivibrio nitroreducens]